MPYICTQLTALLPRFLTLQTRRTVLPRAVYTWWNRRSARVYMFAGVHMRAVDYSTSGGTVSGIECACLRVYKLVWKCSDMVS